MAIPLDNIIGTLLNNLTNRLPVRDHRQLFYWLMTLEILKTGISKAMAMVPMSARPMIRG